MRVPLEWLKEFVDVDIPAEALADRLTMRGLEVEGLERIDPLFSDVIVGEIIDVEKHPNAQKLTVCKVDVGSNIVPVVCGAPNVAQGQKVPLAVPGAHLAEGMVIEKLKVRGVESEGMLCSERELGLSDDHSGILVLDDSAKVGQPLEEAMGLADIILDVNVPPNRGDCQSILGIAREVGGLLGKAVTLPSVTLREQDDIGKLIGLDIADKVACPRYVLRMIRGIAIGAAPFWMRNRITKCGMRPINGIVDVTNYVMLELGQPLHAFDYERIRGRRIEVRLAAGSEVFRTLDGTDRRLEAGDILICDGEGPVAIGGIMGGENSEIVAGTTTVALESAFFNPLSIRRTARRLDIRSEASLRFEKGIDPAGVDFAAQRAIGLMAEVSGGTVIKGSKEIYEKPAPKSIFLDLKKVNGIIGTALEREKIIKLLSSIEIRTEKKEVGGVWFAVPSFRHDINEYIDLIEEVARIHGFEHIPVTMPVITVQPQKKSEKERCSGLAKDYLISAGFYELINFSFAGVSDIENFLLPPSDERASYVSIMNPLAKDYAIMRTLITPGILKSVAYNINRGSKNLRFFEMGKVFIPDPGKDLPYEYPSISLVMTGRERDYFWREQVPEDDFFDLKGVIEGLMERLGIGFALERSKEPFLNVSRAGDIILDNGVKAGWVGELKNEVAASYEIEQKVYCAELRFDIILQRGLDRVQYKAIPRYPQASRDFSFFAEDSVPVADLVEIIKKVSPLIRHVGVFDMFRKETRSIALRVIFQSFEDTLKDERVNELQETIIKELTSIKGVTLRT